MVAKKKAAPRAKKEKAADEDAASSSPAAAPASPAGVSAGTSSRGRERKVTSHFEPSAMKKKSDEELVIEEGPGTALGDIENVKRRMEAVNAMEVEMKALFHACFPNAKTGSQKGVIKKVRLTALQFDCARSLGVLVAYSIVRLLCLLVSCVFPFRTSVNSAAT